MAKKRKSTSKPQKSSSSKQPKIEKPPQQPTPLSESEEEEEEEEELDINNSDNNSSDNNGSSSGTESEDSGSEEEEEEEEEDDSESESEEEEEEEEESEDSKRETISKLLQAFTKEQLIKILEEAAFINPSIAKEISISVDSDPVHRKIFVHGLGGDANSETLVSFFKKYGEIEECKLVTDKVTGGAKGYGFLLFKTRIAARKALKEPRKKVGNRMVSCQLASLGNEQNQKQDRKLFIGNVGPQISVENLRTFFAQFGEIEDGPGGFDKNTGKFRGFAFIVYKSLEGIRKALEEPVKVFQGAKLQCSLATKNSSSGSSSSISSNKPNVVEVPSAGSGSGATVGGNAGAIQGNIGSQGLLNQRMMGQNMNPSGPVFLVQNPALGVLNPVLGLGIGVGASGMLNPAGLNPSFSGGISRSLSRVGNAVAPGFTTQHGVNTISPSMIGSYSSPAALLGLGAYQSSQLSQSSASAAKSQAGIGPVPSYSKR